MLTKLNEHLKYFQTIHPREIDLSLGRMERLMDDLGNPHHLLPPVIHVAGTNGKGSTIAFIRALYEAAGLRVHVYTSPHLIHFNERIVINGHMIRDEVLSHYLSHIQRINNGQALTFFEGITAAAFLAFADHPADIILMETGLGGRLDATNIIHNPAICIITPISYDHMDFLGTTIDEIAHEKAGIIKKNARIIIADQEYPIVYDIMKKKAQDVGAMIIPCPPLPKNASLGLDGIYQKINARAAIGAVKAIKSHLQFTPDIIHQGLQKARWPGRMQCISQNPDVWLEGAHNEAGFQQLKKQLIRWRNMDDRPIHMAIAILNNRDPAMVFHHLKGLVDHVYAIDVQEINTNATTRFHFADEFAKLWSSGDIYQQGTCEILSLEETLKKIMNKSSNNPRNIVTGSLYLVGKVLTLLEEENDCIK